MLPHSCFWYAFFGPKPDPPKCDTTSLIRRKRSCISKLHNSDFMWIYLKIPLQTVTQINYSVWSIPSFFSNPWPAASFEALQLPHDWVHHLSNPSTLFALHPFIAFPEWRDFKQLLLTWKPFHNSDSDLYKICFYRSLVIFSLLLQEKKKKKERIYCLGWAKFPVSGLESKNI